MRLLARFIAPETVVSPVLDAPFSILKVNSEGFASVPPVTLNIPSFTAFPPTLSASVAKIPASPAPGADSPALKIFPVIVPKVLSKLPPARLSALPSIVPKLFTKLLIPFSTLPVIVPLLLSIEF